MNTTNILIVGVGGQGTILASRILSQVVLSAGYDVKVSEIHGMSQRGGSVVTQVRFGEKVHAPIITAGEVDAILAFEQLEAKRWLPTLKEGGTMIVNTQKINPMPVIVGAAKYPKTILADMEKVANVVPLDALGEAMKAGNQKAVNVVLLGVLSARLEDKIQIKEEAWLEALEKSVPAKLLEINMKAFKAGRELAGK